LKRQEKLSVGLKEKRGSNQNCDSVLDVSDEDHAGDLVGLLAFFVDQSEVDVKTVGDCSHPKIKFKKPD